MSSRILPIPILADNYAWLVQDSAATVTAIIDPAEADPIIDAIDQAGGRLDLVLLTHHHADHIAAAEAMRIRYGAALLGARADQARLPPLDRALAPGDRITFGSDQFRVLDTPGHTIGHIAYFLEAGPALFCGDTLFSLGCGRLLEGTAADLFASLCQFAALPDETLVCCGHEYSERNAGFALSLEPDNGALLAKRDSVRRLREAGRPTVPTTLAEERALNPFLRAPDVAGFARLRAARDRF